MKHKDAKKEFSDLSDLIDKIVKHLSGTFIMNEDLRIVLEMEAKKAEKEGDSRKLLVIDSYIKLITEYYKENHKKEDFDNIHSSSEYCFKIVRLLNENSMTHKQLYKTLGISKSNLSNILNRIMGFGIISEIKVGRAKIYSSNSKGIDFLKYIVEQQKNNGGLLKNPSFDDQIRLAEKTSTHNRDSKSNINTRISSLSSR